MVDSEKSYSSVLSLSVISPRWRSLSDPAIL